MSRRKTLERKKRANAGRIDNPPTDQRRLRASYIVVMIIFLLVVSLVLLVSDAPSKLADYDRTWLPEGLDALILYVSIPFLFLTAIWVATLIRRVAQIDKNSLLSALLSGAGSVLDVCPQGRFDKWRSDETDYGNEFAALLHELNSPRWQSGEQS
jgi:hypothetical protein